MEISGCHTLTEQSLLVRQALIIVPHLKYTSHYKPRSIIPNDDTSVSTTATSAPDDKGYFSLWRKGSNPGSFSGSRRSYLVTYNQIKNPSSSRFGSGRNIHTLKRDEYDTKFNDIHYLCSTIFLDAR
uniref:Uncharacterized protein n=1 Tax=Lactuca sativa TaxID=4236 RepID=A0A9R1VHN6_LACSA|nr:hypothetical protein LSAT_V11C500253150 [Lactuca sativa]